MEHPTYQCTNVVASSHTAINLSRHELLDWINESLGKRLRSVEELCSGAIYCQFMDLLFPGCISLKKIRFTANQQHEYMSNLKWLQVAFRKVGCDKDVPIDRLIKGRFQENFEFLQWFKRFYDANTDSEAIISARRLVKEIGGYPKVALGSESRSYGSQTARVLPSQTPSRAPSTQAQLKVPSSHGKPKGHSTETQQKRIGAKTQPCSSGASAQSTAASLARQKQKENELKTKIAQMEELTEDLEREKEFYFRKLRNIEVLCTRRNPDAENPGDADVELNKEELISRILAELQATEEDYGPEVEEDDEETF